jgi:hypothetical protein
MKHSLWVVKEGVVNKKPMHNTAKLHKHTADV